MKRGDVVTPAARLEILDQAAHIGQRSPAVARRFLRAVQETFLLLSRMPGIGSPRRARGDRLAGLRSFRVKDFENHLIFYITEDQGIRVVHVLHAARDIDAILHGGKAPER